jgi:uncharacterized membrane protein YfcA
VSPADPAFWLLVAASFLASAVSGAFAIGGGFLMLAAVVAVLPIAAVVPMHSALMLGTSFGRTFFFWRHVHWPITAAFTAGALIGAPAGTRLYIDLPEVVVGMVVGVFMLAAVWMPPIAWRPRLRHPFFLVGVIHSFLSALFSFGGVMQPLMMRTSLGRLQIIATLSVSLLAMNLFKLGGYFAFGFDFAPYALVTACAFASGIAGAFFGRRLVDRIPEERFRLAFRIIVTALAAQLFYRAWLHA